MTTKTSVHWCPTHERIYPNISSHLCIVEILRDYACRVHTMSSYSPIFTNRRNWAVESTQVKGKLSPCIDSCHVTTHSNLWPGWVAGQSRVILGYLSSLSPGAEAPLVYCSSLKGRKCMDDETTVFGTDRGSRSLISLQGDTCQRGFGETTPCPYTAADSSPSTLK